ncbi:MAG: ABC transporter substrate-binding protein [Muribaculaceae bacterium]
MKNLFLLCALVTIFVSCNGGRSNQLVDSSSIVEAKGFSISSNNNYTVVSVQNPWKVGSTLQSYILVPRDKELPKNLPEGTVIRTPIKSALVYSSVHGGIIKELGAINSIKGVCDASYFNMASIQHGLSKGSVIDAGQSMSPSIEKIIELAPEAIILSPFQNAGYGALTNIGIPIIECADYMEATPLGRAEWIKFFGLLYNNSTGADSIFNDVSTRYKTLTALAKAQKMQPKVISEMVTSGVWYVPGGNSYMAHIIADAGGNYPWNNDKSTGSLSLDFTQVFDVAHDADIWLLKTFGNDLTYQSLKDNYELNAQFDAYQKHHVYSCNTATTSLFEDFPFHPDILLKEYISIFHPSVIPDYTPKYFKPLTK